MQEINIFKITKVWYEYKAEHSDLNGNHTDFLFYCIDLNNRLAWKEVFGLPAIETSEFLNISYNTFRKILNDFTIKHKLIRIVEKSTNQFNSNRISLDLLYQNLLKQKKSTYKAFVKAQQKQLAKQSDIDNTLLHINNNTLLQLKEKDFNFLLNSKEFKKFLKSKKIEIKKTEEVQETNLFEDFTFSENARRKILEFIEYKKEIKRPYKSEKSITSLIKNCSIYSESEIIDCVDKSIMNGWQGLFFEKVINNKINGRQHDTDF